MQDNFSAKRQLMWRFCKVHQLNADCQQSSTRLIVTLKQLRQQTNEKIIYTPKFEMSNYPMSLYGIAFHAWLCVPCYFVCSELEV